MSQAARIVGRYAIFDPIASGGMATVHLGKVLGEAGFCRTVAIKRLHENFAKDPTFVAMMTDEARLVARIRHANVVPTLDVVALDGELFVIMEYIHGLALSELLSRSRSVSRPPFGIGAAIVIDALHGLHAAHEATNERGEPLDVVHRDVSPHNILVGLDGVARVLDFGIAKAVGRVQSTSTGQIKGKLAYMAPEQMTGGAMDRRVDVYAAGIVLWEVLTGRRLFTGENEAQIVMRALTEVVKPPSAFVGGLPAAIDEVVMTALERDPDNRFPTAHDFAFALEKAVGVVPRAREVGLWVKECAAHALDERTARIAEMERLTQIGEVVDRPTVAASSIPVPVALSAPSTKMGTEHGPDTVATGPETLASAGAPSPHTLPLGGMGSAPILAPGPTGATLASAGAVALAPTTLAMPATPVAPLLPAAPTPQSSSPEIVWQDRSFVGSPRVFRGSASLVAALALTALVGVVLIVVSLNARPRRSLAPSASAEAVATPAAHAAPTTSATSVEPVPEPGLSAPPPAASASAAPALPRSARSPSPTAPTTSARSARSSASSDPCNPPYTIDSTGVKIPKRECFVRR